MNTLKDLGMTEQDAVMEIEFMRGWDKFLEEHLESDVYKILVAGYARDKTAKELRTWGISEEEINEICDYVDNTIK